MNDTTKSIVGLLEQGKPELQVAAAQVLGELKPKDETAVRALSHGLARSPVLGRFCLEALTKIGTPSALATLAEAVVAHEVLSEHAAHLLGEIGAPAHGVLARIYSQAIGDQRTRILAVLARELSKESLAVFATALSTPELTETASQLLRSEKQQFVPAKAKALREALTRRLGEQLAPGCVAQILGLLSAVDPNGSKSLFLAHIEPAQPPMVRAAAFRALLGAKLTANQVKSMMESLEDPAQKSVHDAVREVLVSLPALPDGMLPSLKRLLSSRSPEHRLFAVRMLRTAGGSEFARVFTKLLDHDDPRFRAAAADGLARNKQAVEPLLKLLQSTKNADLARQVAAILARLAEYLTPKLLKTTADKGVKLLASNARLGDLLLDLVMQAGGAKIAPFLIDKAVRMRRAHRRAEALHVLAKVAASEHSADEARYQIALTKLLAAEDESEAFDGAPGNSTMGFFAVLVRAGFPLLPRLRRESAVKPEMLLRIASHFMAAVGSERRFGTEVLQYLAAHTKGRAGDEARLALRTVGV